MKRKYIWMSIFIVVLAGAGYGYMQFNRTKPSAADIEPKFKVEAGQILHEFETDEAAANKKYQGLNLVLQVQGTVKGIDTAESGALTLLLGDPSGSSTVRCAIDSLAVTRLSGYTPGTSATVRGYFSGYKADMTGLLGSDLEMNACVPVK